MLYNRGGVRPAWLQDQGGPLDIVLLDKIFLVLIKILRVRYDLLEGLAGEAVEEVLLAKGLRAGWGSIMEVVKLGMPDLLVAAARFEDILVLHMSSHLRSPLPQHLIVVWLPQEVLAWVNKGVSNRI